MNDFITRILKVEIKNFKNVEYGKIEFTSNKNLDINNADILGVYGQNGSGKTTLVNAFELLKTILSGESIPNYVSDFICQKNDSASFSFEFFISVNNIDYRILYQFTIKIKKEHNNKIGLEIDSEKPILFIESEKLQYKKINDDTWMRFKDIVNYNYNGKEILLPKSRLDEIINNNQNIIDELRAAKIIAYKQGTSFIFSEHTFGELDQNSNQEVNEYMDIIKLLKRYGNLYLFIITNESTGLINANVMLPFSFRLESENSLSIGRIPIKLEGPSLIPESIFNTIRNVINEMNIVLKNIIPGLQIDIKNLGNTILKNGNSGINVELISIRNEVQIPLQYESDGIKKIISILHMLICIYNNPSLTLVIDELDTGIFEYLLGEILKIVQDTGKGQLVFTSHNLRPLETLNRANIMFTTTNPTNRYIRFKNVSSHNNLRNIYFHDIALGGQSECIYEPTNSFNIAMAFRMAGETNE